LARWPRTSLVTGWKRDPAYDLAVP
jgi:hypothetical protein